MRTLMAILSLVMMAFSSANADDSLSVFGTVSIGNAARVSSVTTKIYVSDGCGRDNQKCSCSYDLSA